MKRSGAVGLVCWTLVAGAAAGLEAEDFVRLSADPCPPVAVALNNAPGALQIFVEVGRWTTETPVVELGVAAARAVRLSSAGARTADIPGGMRFAFRVAAADLLDDPADWAHLRLALAVRWPGPGGDRQRERFRCLDGRAAHAPLPADPALWEPLSLTEYERLVADRRNRLTIGFSQPFDGRATVVIDDATGRRVRNLVSGQKLAQGAGPLEWDGLDDTGTPVAPGEYRWRAISHPGLTPRHLFNFADGPGSNHGTFQAATTNGELIFFGAPVAEGGHELVALTATGERRFGVDAPMGHGLARVRLAADERYLYAAYDGGYWGQRIDRTKPDWKTDYRVGLVRVDLSSGAVVDWPNKQKLALLHSYEVGPASAGQRADRPTLAGLALAGGRLWVACAGDDRLLAVEPATGQVAEERPLPQPGELAARGELLAAVSAGGVVKLDPATGRTTPLVAAGALDPRGLAFDPAGRLYISDGASHTVKVYPASLFEQGRGEIERTLGRPGGAYVGAYEPERWLNPGGLVVGPNGWLWVTEPGRWTPKRLAACDPATGRTALEFFGPTAYGAPGAGMDPEDKTRWFGQNALWRLDFERRTAVPTALVGGREGMHYRFFRTAGRTFVWSYGKATFLQELRTDGTLQPLACLSSAHQFAYYYDWHPPAAFSTAYNAAYPARQYVSGRTPPHGDGLLWVDRNGDGEYQAEEFEFATAAANLAGSGWGHDFADLTIRVAATVGQNSVLVTLTPAGWYPGGAPRYPALNEAIAAAPTIARLPNGNQVESTVDTRGTLILNSDPTMMAFGPDGTLQWTYPNRWTNVHGSHKAPLPRTGELQGVLFFTGVAPLDEVSDVMVLNGNHGRLFVMTTDGLYLDELFKDIRVGGGTGPYRIGGECFGGMFARSAADGQYYLQAGGIEYRVFRLEGLDRVRRTRGTVTVTPAQAAAAERQRLRTVAETTAPRTAVIGRTAQPPRIDGRDDDWPTGATAQWDKDGRFPVTVKAAWDDTALYLYYLVRDTSPWVNGGRDWQTLFKTGDSIDLQLGVDPTAPADRTGPAPGDLRVLVAPYGDQPVVVLYRHRAPGAPAGEAVVFQSPWRAEKVDSVRRLETATVAVRPGNGEYRVEVALPLAELGLTPRPGAVYRADFGVIYGDAEGTVNTFRNYWSNQATNLVNDVPGEIMLTPRLWGTARLQEAGR